MTPLNKPCRRITHAAFDEAFGADSGLRRVVGLAPGDLLTLLTSVQTSCVGFE
jgi:hypothetical protein